MVPSAPMRGFKVAVMPLADTTTEPSVFGEMVSGDAVRDPETTIAAPYWLGMRMVKDAESDHVLPFVTACEGDSVPVASKREFVLSTIA